MGIWSEIEMGLCAVNLPIPDGLSTACAYKLVNFTKHAFAPMNKMAEAFRKPHSETSAHFLGTHII